jgi:hypothetical protein
MYGQLYPPVKESLIPIGQEAGWTPELVWTLWRREKTCTVGIQTPAIQPIAILTELSQSPIVLTELLLTVLGHQLLMVC